MNIYVDIDETICCTPDSRDYNQAQPIVENIDKINKLHEQGHEITYWTARGTVTGINWFDLTKKQLIEWGCKWNNLIVGTKPAYDLLICDKTKRIEEI